MHYEVNILNQNSSRSGLRARLERNPTRSCSRSEKMGGSLSSQPGRNL
jgi:hypothetical protein